MNKKKTVLIFTLLLSCFLHGQNTKISNQQWFNYFNQLKISPKSSISNELSARWRDKFATFNIGMYRVAYTHQLNKKINVAGAFGLFSSINNQQVTRWEYRIHQEIAHTSSIKKLEWRNRIRIEERFFNNPIKDINSFNLRFRFLSQISIPIKKWSEDKKLNMGIGNELFIQNLNKKASLVFDQNRILISPTLQINKKIELRFTYNGQYSVTQNTKAKEYNSIYWFTFIHKLSLVKSSN